MGGATAGFVRRHPLGCYFALAWGLSWATWTPLVTDALGLTRSGLPAAYHYAGSAGPLLAAVIVTALADGTAGLRELMMRFAPGRVGAAWLVAGWLGPVALFFAAAALLRATGAPWPDFRQLARADEFPRMGPVELWAFWTLTFGFGEETGWRGFALPRLQAKHGALKATLLLTAGWVIWHAPAFFYRPGYTALGLGGTVGFAFSLLVGAIVLTWLFNSAGGSLVPVILFHGSIEVVYLSRATRADIAAVLSVLFTVWAVLVVWLGGPTNLSRRGRVVPGSDRRLPGPRAHAA